MNCRWTDGIVADLTGPDAPGLDREAERHLAGCGRCRAAVRRADRMDAALAKGLRPRRTDELPRTVLVAPLVPRRSGHWRSSTSLLAIGATMGVAAIASGIALGPRPPASSPGPVSGSQRTSASAVASPRPADLQVGAIAAVVNEPDTVVPLVVRTEPGTADPATITAERLYTGQRVRILAGPVEANGYPWYEVTVGEIHGWAAAETKDGSSPWLDTVSNGEIAYGVADARARVAMMNAAGGEPRVILERTPTVGLQCADSVAIHWSADGAFAVVGDPELCAGEGIERIEASGDRTVSLGTGMDPTISPDGSEVTYADGETLLSVTIDGVAIGGARPLGIRAPDLVARRPAWSPDGRLLAFSARRGSPLTAKDGPDDDVYIYDGMAVRHLASGTNPKWSADGRWVVFGDDRETTGQFRIYRIRPDGTGEEDLGVGAPESVAMSPDGTTYAVVVTRGENPAEVVIRRFEREPPDLISLGIGASPAWSPDGEFIAWAEALRGGPSQIRVARADGTERRVLGIGFAPSWRPIIGQSEEP